MNSDITLHLQQLDSDLDSDGQALAIILAAGHGKRIKSETSKMLHEIWGEPTVLRVANAASRGLDSDNQIIVVGIKATEVANAVGKRSHRGFAFQAEQNGTGDAVRTALDSLNGRYQGDVYIFPGDIGLLSADAVRKFREDFLADSCDMMVLTGVFEGSPEDNYYGRILRVPSKDGEGESSGNDCGKVIEIKELKDIIALEKNETYNVAFQGRNYRFTRHELLALNEFNTGVFAFRGEPLRTRISELTNENVQGELYLTDIISVFNRAGLTVKATSAIDNREVLGFNIKSVLREMEDLARDRVYDQLKDIITIRDRNDFFIADDVVKRLIELDNRGPLDICIGRGVYLGKNVELGKKNLIGDHAFLDGRIVLGEGVHLQGNVHLTTFPGQTLEVGANSEIFKGCILKGNLHLGENTRIEVGVNITGSDEFPTRIGNNVVIKGTSYIFGGIIENDLLIEHSVIKCKRVQRITRPDGSVQSLRYFLPDTEGEEMLEDLGK